MSNFEV